MLAIYHERTENLINPIGLDNFTPHFSWNIDSDGYHILQHSYRILVFNLDNQRMVWDSGNVLSESTNNIKYQGEQLKARGCYCWNIYIEDNNGETAISEGNTFELGITASDWVAKWTAPIQNEDVLAIEDVGKGKLFKMFGAVSENKEKPDGDRHLNPVSYMRKKFHVREKHILKARIYITARGLYEVFMNGKTVTDTLFNPGFSSYHKYLDYQTYDITELINEQENIIGIKLGEGWYKGKYGVLGFNGNYGKEISVLFQIEIKYSDGSIQTIKSDRNMLCNTGAICYSDLLIGEKYDATKELEHWNEVDFDEVNWESCYEVEGGYDSLKGLVSEPIRILMKKKPFNVIKTPKGEMVLDMGQNMVGYLEMEINGLSGMEVKLEYSEILDEEGNFINNISGYNRDQTDIYIVKGKLDEIWHPTFTFHGFRYVRVTGYPGAIDPECFTAFVIGTDCEKSGSFYCSEPEINQLQSNIVWSQRSNFISIPTDCPQRERAGWTGDVLIYCNTASYNANTKGFYRRWLNNLRLEQDKNGLVPIVIPYAAGYSYLQVDMFGSDTSAGWGDVIIYLPWLLYKQYDDISILEENFTAMHKWMQYVENEVVTGIPEDLAKNCSKERLERQKYLWNTKFHFGDWLYPSCKNEKGETDMFGSAARTKDIVATAMYANSSAIMSECCNILGEKELATYYKKLNKKIRKAFEEEYINENGRIENHLQGLYVLILQMKMVSENKEKKVAEQLAKLILENNNCLDTGFMSIKYLMDVLCKYGYEDIAKNILFQDQCPSWLYEVKNGATTLWETWDAILPNGKPTTVSYNHYAFGCIGDWMYRNLLGINLGESGYKKFIIKPKFHFGLTSAKGTYLSINGKIEFSWQKIGTRQYRYMLIVPANTTAEVFLPEIYGNTLTVNNKSVIYQTKDGENSIVLGSGKYDIQYLTL